MEWNHVERVRVQKNVCVRACVRRQAQSESLGSQVESVCFCRMLYNQSET
jgi:hypothetical protein